MSCTAAGETRGRTSALLSWGGGGPVDVRFRPFAYGSEAIASRPSAFHLGSWCSLITSKMTLVVVPAFSSLTLFSAQRLVTQFRRSGHEHRHSRRFEGSIKIWSD